MFSGQILHFQKKNLVVLNKKRNILHTGRIFNFLVYKVSIEKVYFNTLNNIASTKKRPISCFHEDKCLYVSKNIANLVTVLQFFLSCRKAFVGLPV